LFENGFTQPTIRTAQEPERRVVRQHRKLEPAHLAPRRRAQLFHRRQALHIRRPIQHDHQPECRIRRVRMRMRDDTRGTSSEYQTSTVDRQNHIDYGHIDYGHIDHGHIDRGYVDPRQINQRHRRKNSASVRARTIARVIHGISV
jgi:hypothetical protein